MAKQTLGRFLVNDVLPQDMQIDKTLNKSATHKMLTTLAQKDRASFVRVATDLKRLGDRASTLEEGASVGLSDIEPMYKERDSILNKAVAAFKLAVGVKQQEKIILDTQDALMSHTKDHPGALAMQARSGARGNIPQLLKTVSSPVAAVDARGTITPWLITKSYAEGLPAADYWVANNEARLNTIKSALSVSEPGDAFKILTNTLYPFTVTEEDCKTHNGIKMALTSNHAPHRYLTQGAGSAPAGTLLTKKLVAELAAKNVSFVFVRSPATCEAEAGVCAKCMGLDENLRPYSIGTNAGVRAAQSMAEPLTQFSLNAKHGVRVLKGSGSAQHTGVAGLRQLLDVPESFSHRATLAEIAGSVTRILPAAHGGHFVHVAERAHYVPPNLAVVVKQGQHVEAGDVLSDGVPKPDEVVHHKGIGVGREYLTDVVHKLYAAEGTDLDRRHLELLARAQIGHVRVLETHDDHPNFLRGDLVPYHTYKKLVMDNRTRMSTSAAKGHILAEEVLRYSVGTPVTDSVAQDLTDHNIDMVYVTTNVPAVEAEMRPIIRTPLLNPDWLARMSHKFLKDSVLRAAHQGETSDLHSTHPVPAYALGLEFGQGKGGRY